MHDSTTSHSLLGQLGLKETLRFVDTGETVDPRNLAPTQGLVIMRASGVAGAYAAPLDDLPGERIGRTSLFPYWWMRPVSKLTDGRKLSRRDYVLPVANREGGAHVDPALDALFDDFVNRNPFGWTWASEGGGQEPFLGNAALEAVRQIAYELEETIRPLLGRSWVVGG